MKQQYVLCVDNSAYPASLEALKIYRLAADQPGDSRGMLRVIDESGEDYLYPSRCFADFSLKEPLRRIVTTTFRTLDRHKAAA
jgi:hypothetical protein